VLSRVTGLRKATCYDSGPLRNARNSGPPLPCAPSSVGFSLFPRWRLSRRAFGSFDRTQSCARTTRHVGHPSRPASHKTPTATFLMLNSARRHCISPRRGRRVEWSDPRRGSERLHFRARRFCRRCACDASQDSVGNAGCIDVTTTDNSLVIDSV
jgi:hypothetical protein